MQCHSITTASCGRCSTPASNSAQHLSESCAGHGRKWTRGPDNTAIAMDPKKEEWMHFCDAMYPSDLYRHLVTHEKAYTFLCYQSFRELKKRGGNKAHLQGSIFFNHDDYKAVMAQFVMEGGAVVNFSKPNLYSSKLPMRPMPVVQCNRPWKRVSVPRNKYKL